MKYEARQNGSTSFPSHDRDTSSRNAADIETILNLQLNKLREQRAPKHRDGTQCSLCNVGNV
jgi:hypothetical protein